MAMKTKMLGFVPESCMFVGANYDNEGKLGIVTFSDDCPYDKKARQLTDEALKDDKGYQLLTEIGKKDICDPNKLLQRQASKMATDIWSLLFHDFLIKELRENGWTIITAASIDFKDIDLSENHMQI